MTLFDTKQKKQLFLLVMAVFLFIPSFAFAGSTLSLSPASGTYNKGDQFTVRVMVDPAGTKINVVEATLNFSKDLISVVKVSKEAAFTLWATEPAFSNPAGTISMAGGAPAGVSGKSAVLSITFKANQTGNASLSFASGAVLAADGKGTNTLENKTGGAYTIQQAAAPPKKPALTPAPVPQTLPEAEVVKPETPKITSSTHEDSDKWYAKDTAEFSWDLPGDVVSLRLALSKDENGAPDQEITPPKNSHKIESIEGGQWYFLLQLKNKAGWGEVGKKKILVDNAPPLEFEIKLLDQGVHQDSPRLAFETQDELSGIDRYELTVGSETKRTVYPANIVGGNYPLPPQPGGQSSVKVAAYDKAGNAREMIKDLILPYVAEAAESAADTEQSRSPLVQIEYLLLFLFVFASGILLAMNIIQKSKFRKKIAQFQQEAAEIREKTDKIFTALRDEIEDQIGRIDERPQLTAGERNAIEKIREALDLSEELISAEVDDLTKLSKDR